MKWLNIEVSTLRSPEYIGSEPLARATWLNVFAYCVEQENSGIIKDCEHWKDRQWQQTCGVTKDEIGISAPLLTWSDGDLIVWNYPIDKELEVQSKRNAGRETVKKRWGNSSADSSAINSATSSAISLAGSSADTERKGIVIGKERKDIDTDLFEIFEKSNEETAQITVLKKKFIKPTIEECVEFSKEISIPTAEGEKFFHYQESKGWKVGSEPMKNWKSAMQTWKGNLGSFTSKLENKQPNQKKISQLKPGDKYVDPYGKIQTYCKH